MVSRNNRIERMEQAAERQSHFGIRKLTIGAASVLLGTTLWLGTNANVTHAESSDANSNGDASQAQESNNATPSIGKNTQVTVVTNKSDIDKTDVAANQSNSETSTDLQNKVDAKSQDDANKAASVKANVSATDNAAKVTESENKATTAVSSFNLNNNRSASASSQSSEVSKQAAVSNAKTEANANTSATSSVAKTENSQNEAAKAVAAAQNANAVQKAASDQVKSQISNAAQAGKISTNDTSAKSDKLDLSKLDVSTGELGAQLATDHSLNSISNKLMNAALNGKAVNNQVNANGNLTNNSALNANVKGASLISGADSGENSGSNAGQTPKKVIVEATNTGNLTDNKASAIDKNVGVKGRTEAFDLSKYVLMPSVAPKADVNSLSKLFGSSLTEESGNSGSTDASKYNTATDWNGVESAITNGAQGVTISGDITADSDLNISRDFTIVGADNNATLNLGDNYIRNNGNLTLDNITLDGSVLGKGNVIVKGTVKSNVNSVKLASAEDQGFGSDFTSQFGTMVGSETTAIDNDAIDKSNRVAPNFRAGNMTIADNATLTINRTVDGDGIVLADGINRPNGTYSTTITGMGNLHVGKKAFLNITLKDGTKYINPDGTVNAPGFKSSEKNDIENLNVGIRVNNNGTLTTDDHATINLYVGHGRGITFGEDNLNTNPKSWQNYVNRDRGYGSLTSNISNIKNTVQLGNYNTFNLIGRDGIILGNRATFSSGEFSKVNVRNYGHGNGLYMVDYSKMEIQPHAIVNFLSDGKNTGTDTGNANYWQNSYISLGTDGQMLVDHDATLRVKLINRGESRWNDNINIESESANTNPLVRVDNNATLDVQSDASSMNAELISVPLGNSKGIFEFNNVKYVNLQRLVHSDHPYSPPAKALNDEGNLLYMNGKGYIKGSGNYIIFKWNDGTQDKSVAGKGGTAFPTGPAWNNSESFDDNINALEKSANATWDDIASFTVPFDKDDETQHDSRVSFTPGHDGSSSLAISGADKASARQGGTNFKDAVFGFYPRFSQRLVIVSHDSAVRQEAIKGETISQGIERDIKYKNVPDGRDYSKDTVKDYDSYPDATVNGDNPERQDLSLQGYGYVDTTTGKLVQVKTKNGFAVDSTGNNYVMTVTDPKTKADKVVLADLVNGVLTPKLDEDGNEIESSYVAITQNGGLVKGNIDWRLQNSNNSFSGVTAEEAKNKQTNAAYSPVADHDTVASMNIDQILASYTTLTGVKDANGNDITNPTIAQVLADSDYIQSHLNDAKTAPLIKLADQYILYNKQTTPIPYQTVIKYDPTLNPGTVVLHQQGKNGSKDSTGKTVTPAQEEIIYIGKQTATVYYYYQGGDAVNNKSLLKQVELTDTPFQTNSDGTITFDQQGNTIANVINYRNYQDDLNNAINQVAQEHGIEGRTVVIENDWTNNNDWKQNHANYYFTGDVTRDTIEAKARQAGVGKVVSVGPKDGPSYKIIIGCNSWQNKAGTLTINYIDENTNKPITNPDTSLTVSVQYGVNPNNGVAYNGLPQAFRNGQSIQLDPTQWNENTGDFIYGYVPLPSFSGYEYDKTDPTNAKNGNEIGGVRTTFDNNYDATINVYYKHTYSPVNPDHPHDGVDPSQYEKDVKETVHYIVNGSDPNKPAAPADDVQKSKWSRTLTIDNVTGKIVQNGKYDTDWSIEPGQKTTYDQVNTPVINYYHADKRDVPSIPVTQNDITETVTYSPNGKVIPVDPKGNQIPGTDTPTFPTDPTDPTKPTTGVIPNVPKDWTPDNPNQTPGSNINPDPNDPSKDVKVPFHTQDQRAHIIFVDDDNNEATLAPAQDASGKSDTAITFANAGATVIDLAGNNTLTNSSDKSKKYIFVGVTGEGSTNADAFANVKFPNYDDDTKVDQTFTVHFKHNTVPVTPNHPDHGLKDTDLNKYISRTINYQDTTGKAVNGSPDGKSTYIQTAHFTRTAIVDEVTNEVLGYDTDGDGKVDVSTAAGDYAWAPVNNSNQFSAVNSRAPQDVGYNNVDIPVVQASTVTALSDPSTITVTYSKNAEQGAFQIHYIDEDDNDAVLHSDPISGHYDDPVHYDPTSEIQILTSQGYVQDTGYNKADKYVAQTTINKDNNGKIYVIAFKHGTKQGKQEVIVPTETIHFVYSDGTQAAPDVHGNASNFEFTRTPTVDAVDGHIIDPGKWNAESYTFNDGENNVKAIDGYTPNKATYGNKTATPTNKDVEDTVIYTKNPTPPAKQQGTVIVGFYDDTDNTPIAGVGYNSGKQEEGTAVTYNPSTDQQKLINEGYVYVRTDGTLPTTVPVGTTTVTIHMKHGTQPVNPDNPGKPNQPINPHDPDPNGPKYPNGTDKQNLIKTITRTIHYTGAGGQTPKDVTQTVNFTASGVLDKVTGEWITPLTWSEDKTVNEVTSPTIKGYHVISVDRDGAGINVGAVTLTHANNSYTVNVTYAPDAVPPTKEKGSITVTFHDDTTNTDLQGYGNKTGEVNSGTKYTYNPQTDLDRLIAIGYKEVGTLPTIPSQIPNTDLSYIIHVVHGTQPVNPTNPGTPQTPNKPGQPQHPTDYAPDSLTKTITRTIHYTGAGDQTPQDVKQQVTFTRSGVYDTVTGQWITPLTWSSDQTVGNVTSPTIDGYHVTGVDKDSTNNKDVDSKILTHADSDYVVTVTYAPDAAPVVNKGTIEVTVHDVTDNVDLPQYSKQSGSQDVGTDFTYDKTGTITDLTNHGYKVLNPDVVIPTKITEGDHSTIIYVEHTFNPVNPNHPHDGVDPSQYEKDVKETVHYEGAGSKTPADHVQTSKWSRTLTIDNVTGKIVSGGQYDTDWSIEQGQKTVYDQVDTPVVGGYHADHANVPATQVTQNDITKIVVYSPNGKIIPVDPNHNPIPDAPTPQYPTNPKDPTNVTPNEPVPTVPGYTPTQPTVTPSNPGTDTPVVYVKDQVAQVVYRDVNDPDHIITLDTDKDLTGKAGEAVKDDQVPTKIQNFENAGYVLVDNQFTNPIFDDVAGNVQTFYVDFKHGNITINPNNPGKPGTPINPNDPNGPKWGDDTDKDHLQVHGSQTVHYQGAGDKTPADKVQNVDFNHEVVIDKVTGKQIADHGWTVVDPKTGNIISNGDSHKFGTETTQVVTGYVADKKTAGGLTATVQNPNVKDTVTYTAIGKIVPVDPNGNPIPGASQPKYQNDPHDPTKVLPNEPIPNVPGWTPDSTKPITPTDPTKDTPVFYHKTPVTPPTPENPSNPPVPTNPVPNPPTPTPTPSTPTPNPTTPTNVTPHAEPTPTPTPTPEPAEPSNVTPHAEPTPEPATPAPKPQGVPTPQVHTVTPTPENVTPHPEHVTKTVMPNGQVVDHNGNVTGYVDQTGNVHSTLPQTGEDSTNNVASILAGGAAVAISLIGLAGVRKRRD